MKLLKKIMTLLFNLSVKMLKRMFSRERREFSLISIMIIIALFAMSTEDLSAHEELTFNLNPPGTHSWDFPIDYDKLVRAIGMHETNGCTTGSGRTHLNAGGVMTWPNGVRQFKRYASCEDSYDDMKRIWVTYYGGLPNLAKAKKYSGSDRAEAWLKNTLYFYYK